MLKFSGAISRLAFLLVLFLTSFLSAAVKEEDTRTLSEAGRFDYSWFNGNFWTARMESAQQKTYFILGLVEGIMLEQRQLYNKTDDAQTRDLIEKETLGLMGSKYTLSEIIKRIDSFYSVKSNLKIPIADAYIKALADLADADEKKKLEILKKLQKDR